MTNTTPKCSNARASEGEVERQLSNSMQEKQGITLVGRKNEIETLVEAFRRSICDGSAATKSTTSSPIEPQQPAVCTPQQLVLIKGTSGTGKTALANSLRPLIKKQGGFFLSGKFELSGRQDPYAVFKVAFTDFIETVLREEEEPLPQPIFEGEQTVMLRKTRLLQLREAIQNAVAAEGRFLTDLIPALERLIGKPDEMSKMSGSEALRRFQYVFCKFCHAISTVVPLVLFLDDLQWGDQASLTLLHDLLRDDVISGQRGSLLVVATYRIHENFTNKESHVVDEGLTPGSPFQIFVSNVHLPELVTSLQITEVLLDVLDEGSINELIATTLKLPADSTRSLSRLVYTKSHGNVFHALQYLRFLVDDGVIATDPVSQASKWLDRDLQALSERHHKSVDDLVRQKIRSLPAFAQELLMVGSCIGDEIDVSTLLLVFAPNSGDIAGSLDLAVCETLLEYLPDQGRFRFTHDRIRSAAQSCIPDMDNFCYETGLKLWSRSPPIVLSASLCIVTNLVNKGIQGITDQSERYKLADLNLRAGERASAMHSFPEAAEYFRTGIELLSKDSCWKEQYDLTLKLYNGAADAELCNQDFARVLLLTAEAQSHAKCFDDKLAAYFSQIYAIGQNGSLEEAINVAIKVVRQLGVDIPTKPTDFAIISDLIKTSAALIGKSDEAILSLPLMRDEKFLAAVLIMNIIAVYAIQSGSPFLPIIGTRLVRLTLKHGLSKGCANGFTIYSFLVARTSTRQCYRFGQLALHIASKLRAREMIPRVHACAYFESNHWVHPVRNSFEPLKKAVKVGLDIGDVEYACLGSLFHGVLALYSGIALAKAHQLLNEASVRMTRYKQNNFLQIVNVNLHVTSALLNDDKELSETVHDLSVWELDHKVASIYRYSWGTNIAYLVGDISQAASLMKARHELNFDVYSDYTYAVDQYFQGLVAVAQVRSGIHPRRNVKAARGYLKTLKSWAKDCRDNFFNKQVLLEAELRSLKTSKSSCSETNTLYGSAYSWALKQGFTLDAALACELAGNYMHEQGQSSLALEYWKKAHSLYFEWGGRAKAAQLVRSKPDLRDLSPDSRFSETNPNCA